jgi:hypothetical protein
MKLLILLNIFFNYSIIERTVESIIKNNYNCDIIFLENPSKYSDEIKKLVSKYDKHIHSHYICNDNIEGNIFTLFISKNISFIKEYDFVAMSEADVILDKDSIKECIEILNESHKHNICSIDIHMDYKKYNKLPIRKWVPQPNIHNNFSTGHTGFQFIMMKTHLLLEFIESILNKKISGAVALGSKNFTGLSDTNLNSFINSKNLLWYRTIHNKLDHIGWELYLEDNEYVQLKNKNLKEKKIRYNDNLNNYFLKKIK